MNTENHYQETDLGNISLNPRGEYNPEESYEYLDLVVLEGGSYVCLAENGATITGISPESGKTTQYWQVITIPGSLTPEYIAMHDRVVNLSEQVGADAVEVRTAEQNVSGMELNVTQMQEQTRQSAEAAEQSKDSSAGYAASADASRQAAEESKQNIDAQVTGFDNHVAEKTGEAENDIEAARIAANKAIIAQQEQSVNEVARVGTEAVSTAQAAAQTATEKAQAAATSEKNAAASETAAKLSEENATKMAEQVATDKEQVAYDRTAVENAKQEMTGSVAQIEQNTHGISELKNDLSNYRINNLLKQQFRIGYVGANGIFYLENQNHSFVNEIGIKVKKGDVLTLSYDYETLVSSGTRNFGVFDSEYLYAGALCLQKGGIINHYESKEDSINILEDGYLYVTVDQNMHSLSIVRSKIAPSKDVSWKKFNRVVVAPHDAGEEYKLNADFVCKGVNDEVTLQTALDALDDSGELILLNGIYHIDAFNTPNDGGAPYVMCVKSNKNKSVIIKGESIPFNSFCSDKYGQSGAIIKISQSCYDSLNYSYGEEENNYYTIIRAECNNKSREYTKYFATIKNLSFDIPDNQKSIICIDGLFFSALSIEHITGNAVKEKTDGLEVSASKLHIPVNMCIGVRGLLGSNWGKGNIWKSSFMFGFNEGFACIGEHLILEDLGTRYCNYGYTFNNLYTVTRSISGNLGAYAHDMTVINCCDEVNFNLPYFGTNNLNQAIHFINFNLEVLDEYFALGGQYAKELIKGSWRGSIEFTDFHNYRVNSVMTKFWEDGNGHGMYTKNLAHKPSGTSEERNSYFPQYMQEFYDTTLEKKLIYDGSKWVDCNGNTIE